MALSRRIHPFGLFVLVATGLVACEGSSEPSSPHAVGGAGTGGQAVQVGGTPGSGGNPTAGGVAGGAASGGDTGAGGAGGGSATSGMGGLGGLGGTHSLGGTGGKAGDRSDEPALASAIAAQDSACRAACTTALVCQPAFGTLDKCLTAYYCTYVDIRVDVSRGSDDELLSCLNAATVHMKCVAGLECARYYEWWNEGVQPFPCQAEQTAEEQACASTQLFPTL